MKLKAPQGAGDPCVASVIIAACDGLYEVEAEIGALLIESFGFIEIEQRDSAGAKETSRPPNATRRRTAAKKPPQA